MWTVPGRPGLAWAVLGVVLSAAQAAAAGPKPAVAPELRPEKPPEGYRLQPFDAPALPHEPLHPMTERDRTRIDAAGWYMTGRLRQKREQPRDALEAYRKAVELDPEAIEVYRVLVPLAFELEETEEAIRYAVKAAELSPENHQLLHKVGILLARRGQVARGLELLERALESSRLDEESAAYVRLMRDVGLLYRATDQTEKAAEAFEVVFDALEHPGTYQLDLQTQKILNSDPATALERIGQTFLEADRPELAIRAFERAAETGDGPPGHLAFNLAQVYLQTDQPEKALSELQKYLDAQLQSKGRKAYQLLADILQELDRSDELLPRLEKLAEADSRNSALQYFLAEQYVAAGQLDRAEALYKKVLESSDDPEGYLGLAAVYRQQREPDKLLEVLVQASEGGEMNLERLEAELEAIGKDEPLLESLLAHGRELAETRPARLDFTRSFLLAQLATRGEKTKPALRFCRLTIEKANRQQFLVFYELFREPMNGFLEAVEEHPEAVIETYRTATNHPVGRRVPVFAYWLSMALELDGRTEEALKVIRNARGRNDTPVFEFQEAWIHYHARQWDKAIPLFKGFIDKHSGGEGQPMQLVRQSQFSLSNIYVQQGEMEKGETVLERVLEEDPENPQVNNDLGYLWADQGKNLEQAETMIRKAVQAEPENAAYLDSLGWVLYQRGKYEKALEHLEKAAHMPDGADPTVWDHLGDCYEQLGQQEKAVEAWRKALEHAEDSSRTNPDVVERVKEKLGREELENEDRP